MDQDQSMAYRYQATEQEMSGEQGKLLLSLQPLLSLLPELHLFSYQQRHMGYRYHGPYENLMPDDLRWS